MLESGSILNDRAKEQDIYADAYGSSPDKRQANRKYDSGVFGYPKHQHFDSRAADLGDCIPGDRLSPFRKRQSSDSKQLYSSEKVAF